MLTEAPYNKAVNIPITVLIYARQKGVAKVNLIRILYVIKSLVADSRGEFDKNISSLGEKVNLSREYTYKLFRELQLKGFIVRASNSRDTRKLRVVSQKKISQKCAELLGGLDNYRAQVSINKVCKIPPGLLSWESKSLRVAMDLALLLEEHGAQTRAIIIRHKKDNINRRQQVGDLLLSDGDSPTANVPVLSCANAGSRFHIGPSTMCRRFKALEKAGPVVRERREQVLARGPENAIFSSKNFDVISPNEHYAVYYSKGRQALIHPLPSSFSIIQSLGIEWVRRKMT